MPQLSPLLPYTTLFRSERSARDHLRLRSRPAHRPTDVRVLPRERRLPHAARARAHVRLRARDRGAALARPGQASDAKRFAGHRSEEHTSELQSPCNLVCRSSRHSCPTRRSSDLSDRLEIIYDFEADPPIGRQTYAFCLGNDDFLTQLAPARTFVFEHETEELRSRGLGKHLTPKDLLVISPDGPIDNPFRYPNECVRHKVLDLIGDLYLVGRPIRGRLVAHKSGHELNHQLARRLVTQYENTARESLVNREAPLDTRRIQRILPHRYPMLMVDRVLEVVGDHKAVGIKNVTFNDIFFQGHYPGTPIMPGVLIVEALAQLDQKS